MKISLTTIFLSALTIASGDAQCAAPPLNEAVAKQLEKEGLTPEQVRAGYNACDSGGPISMSICFRYRLKGEEMRLEATYSRLHQALEKEYGKQDRDVLASSQETWQKFQRLHCELESIVGTFDDTTETLACLWTATKQRADSLEELLGRWNSVDR